MPRCQNCGNSARSYELREVGAAVVCPTCRKPKSVEDKMVDKKKRLVSLTLSEVPTPDKAADHEIDFEGGYGGLEVRFNTTFDKVRAFFTQKREKGKRAEFRTIK